MSDNTRTLDLTLTEIQLENQMYMQITFGMLLASEAENMSPAVKEAMYLAQETQSNFFIKLKDQHPDVFAELKNKVFKELTEGS